MEAAKLILYPNDGTRDDRVWVHDLDEDDEAEAEARKAITEYEAEQAAINEDAAWAIGAEQAAAAQATGRPRAAKQ